MSYESDNSIAESLGKKIALERKISHLSQKQLAEDICSQSMISSIEKGNYIPNAILLSKLCKRLNISMDNAVLSNYLEIDKLESFNKTIKALCDKHDYAGMLEYLDESGVLDDLFKDEDFQTYYYYYGVATYQYLHNTKLSLRHLRLAYNYTITPNKKVFTPNEILILSNIAFLKVHSGNKDGGFKDFQRALQHIHDKQFTRYDENMNILFYQYGRCLFETEQYEAAIQMLIRGIDWTTLHSSHYMLSDFFLILSKAYNITNKPHEAQDALSKSKVIENIFRQDTYKL